MSEPITVDLGAVTAYADAVEQGYTGTREEFGELLANFAKRADEVKQDKEEVKQAKEEVFSKAESFDKHVEDEKNRVTEEFNSNAEQVLNTNKQELGTVKDSALEELTSLKEDAVTQVNKTKTDGVQEITTLTNEKKSLLENTGTNQKNLVESEGTKQIQVVENKGTATLATIPEDYTALNTSVNDLKDLMHMKAPAIVEEATSGKEITVNDSADGMRLQGLNVYGKSWQVTTTGSNLFKITKTSETLKGITFDVRKDGTIKISGTNTEGSALYVILGTFEVVAGQTYIFNNFYSLENSDIETFVQVKNVVVLTKINEKEKNKYMYTAKEDGMLDVRFKVRAGVTVDVTLSKMQINVGETVLPYEPYTGGKPSPSPDYPQEIQSAGYVLSTGKNLFDADKYYSEFKQPDGTYRGKTVDVHNVRISLSEFVGKQVTLSVKVTVSTSTSSVYIVAYIGSEQKRFNGSTITSGLTGKSILTVTPVSNTDYFIISYGSGNYDVTFSEIQLEEGNIDTTYEPYTGVVPALYQKNIEVKLIGKNLSNIKSAKLSTKKVKSDIVQWTKKDKIYFSCDTENVTDSGVNVDVHYCDENKKRIGSNGAVLKTNGTRNEVSFTGSGAGSNSTKIDLTTVSYVIVQIGLLNDTYKTSFIDNIMLCDEANQPYMPYKQPQSLPITTSTGLPAIPVPSGTSGITYTDSDGQAWIADEIDFARGKYIQRVWQAEFDGSEDERWQNEIGTKTFYSDNVLPVSMSYHLGFSNKYIANKGNMGITGIQFGRNNRHLCVVNDSIFDESLSDYGLSNWKAHLAEKPLKVMTYLDTPIETDLSEEQIQAYKAVHTNKPTTIISNNADAWMGASYAADTKIWIENKVQEIASAVIASASEAE